jgi:hypothetical protein
VIWMEQEQTTAARTSKTRSLFVETQGYFAEILKGMAMVNGVRYRKFSRYSVLDLDVHLSSSW